MPDYRRGFKWAKREHYLEGPVNALIFLSVIVCCYAVFVVMEASRTTMFMLFTCVTVINALVLTLHTGARISHCRF